MAIPAHADDGCSGDTARGQRHDQAKPEQRQNGGGGEQVAGGHQRGRTGRDDAGVLQGENAEKQTDSRGDAHLQAERDGVDDPAPHGRQAQRHEQESGNEDRPERHLPPIAQLEDDDVAEERVETHPRGERHGVVGVEPHDEGAERGREAGRDEDGVERHARIGENLRVNEGDVGHRQKCR